MSRNNRKLSHLLINPKFQLSIIASFFSLALLACGVLYVGIYWIFQQSLEHALQSGLAKDQAYLTFLHWQKQQFDLAFLFAAIVLSFAIVIGGTLLSHKIAGPIYRFTKYLQEQKSQRPPGPLNFRKGDYFSEIPGLFNEFLSSQFEEKQSNEDDKKAS